MIKRFCDICGEELDVTGHIIKLPRMFRVSVRGGKGGDKIIGKVDTMGYNKTEVCPTCEYKIAMSLPIIEE